MSKYTKQYIKKLQECTNVDQATQILNALKAGPAVRKLVETGVMLRNHPDPIQRQYGSSFIQAAIREEEEDEKKNDHKEMHEQVPPTEQPTPHQGEPAEEPIKEELLAGGDQDGTGGSEQSTDNTEPYPQVGKMAPNSDIENMTGASGEDQMKEMGGQWPGQIPGIEPSVANEMGNNMAPLPQMNTPQMMKQMHYTVQEAMKRYVVPLRNVIKAQQEAIKSLSRRVQESEARTGSMKLDIQTVKQHAMAKPHTLRETGFPTIYPTIVGTGDPRKYELDSARAEINQLDKQLRTQPQQPYQ